MKKHTLILFGTFLGILIMAAFGKEGPIGPQGQQGPEWIQGVRGPDGTMIHHGTSAPKADIGKPGDYYLDKTKVLLYGPKTASGWGDSQSLQGAAGEPGKRGAQLLFGKELPDPSVGMPGDYYMYWSTMALFGPKKPDNTWPESVLLQKPGIPGTSNIISSAWIPFPWHTYNPARKTMIKAGLHLSSFTAQKAQRGKLKLYPMDGLISLGKVYLAIQISLRTVLYFLYNYQNPPHK